MQKSTSWEANSSSSKEIPRILWSSKVHYRVHNSPPPVPVLRKTNFAFRSPMSIHCPSHPPWHHPNNIWWQYRWCSSSLPTFLQPPVGSSLLRAGSGSCSQTASKPVPHIPLLCVQRKTPDDGQRNCPKHVEFYSKNKFEKLVHLVGSVMRNSSENSLFRKR